MKLFFILVFVTTGSMLAFSQSVITRISGGQTEFYYSTVNNVEFIQNVIDNAEHGDTIILPGGLFNINSNNLVINKRLVIFGAGIHLDSTAVTGRTILETKNGWKILLTSGANQVEFHGISFTLGSVQVNDAVSGLTFVRCDFYLLRLDSANGYNSKVSNLLLKECVINFYVEIDGADNVLITNSVIKGLFWAQSSITVKNCLLLNIDQNNTASNSGVIYQNNIFTRDFNGVYNVTELSTFQNNLWILKPGGSVNLPGGLGTNKSTTNMANVFVVSPSYTDFDFRGNYDLKPATIYTTMGSDGKEVGFYGGSIPLKKGFHPANPHWQQLDLPSGTAGGVINNVIIKASAQNN
jgi:hypothetical protein